MTAAQDICLACRFGDHADCEAPCRCQGDCAPNTPAEFSYTVCGCAPADSKSARAIRQVARAAFEQLTERASHDPTDKVGP